MQRPVASLARQALRTRYKPSAIPFTTRCFSCSAIQLVARSPSIRRAEATNKLASRQGVQSAYSRSDTEQALNDNITPILAVLKDAKKSKALEMEPDHAIQLIRAFCRVPKTQKGWEVEFVESMNAEPQVMTILGLILEKSRVGQINVLGGRMLMCAANLGYLPAIIRILTEALMFKRLSAPALVPAMTKLRWYALKQENAEALVLLGRILKSERRLDEALEMFRKAASVDREAGSASDYDVSTALLNQGLILLHRNRHTEAKEAFEKAALELDNAVAYHHLALCLDDADPNKKTYLMKAAASGVPGASRDLAKEFLGDSKNETESRGRAAEAAEIAKQWAEVGVYMDDEGAQDVLNEINNQRGQLSTP